jgi:hypothetical protein
LKSEIPKAVKDGVWPGLLGSLNWLTAVPEMKLKRVLSSMMPER